jgi:predicted nucleic acid-binding protein
VPALWRFEIRDTHVVAGRRCRIAWPNERMSLILPRNSDIAADPAPIEAMPMSPARRYRLAVYDAGYLELAQRTGVPLATLDALLVRAAREEGVALLGD